MKFAVQEFTTGEYLGQREHKTRPCDSLRAPSKRQRLRPGWRRRVIVRLPRKLVKNTKQVALLDEMAPRKIRVGIA